MPNPDAQEGARVSFDVPPRQQRVFEEPSPRLSGVGRGRSRKVRSLKGPGTECISIRKVPLLRDTPTGALTTAPNIRGRSPATPTLREEPVMPAGPTERVYENPDGDSPGLGEVTMLFHPLELYQPAFFVPPMEPGLCPRGRAKRSEQVHPNPDSDLNPSPIHSRAGGRSEATLEQTVREDPRGPRPGITTQPAEVPALRSFDRLTERDADQSEWSADTERMEPHGSQDLGSLDVTVATEGGSGSDSTRLGEISEDYGTLNAPSGPTGVLQLETFTQHRHLGPRPMLRLPVPKRSFSRPLPPIPDPSGAPFRQTSAVSGARDSIGTPFAGSTSPIRIPHIRKPRPKAVPRRRLPTLEPTSTPAPGTVGTALQITTASCATPDPFPGTNHPSTSRPSQILLIPRLAANFSGLPPPRENLDRSEAEARNATLSSRSNTLPRRQPVPVETQSVGVGVGFSLLNLAPLRRDDDGDVVSTGIPEPMHQSTANYGGLFTGVRGTQNADMDGRAWPRVALSSRDTVSRPLGNRPGPQDVAAHGQYTATSVPPATMAYHDPMENRSQTSGSVGIQDRPLPSEGSVGAPHSVGANVNPVRLPASVWNDLEDLFAAQGLARSARRYEVSQALSGSANTAHYDYDRWGLGERLNSIGHGRARDRAEAERSGGSTAQERRPMTGSYRAESDVARISTLGGRCDDPGSHLQRPGHENAPEHAREARSWRTHYSSQNGRQGLLAGTNEASRNEPQRAQNRYENIERQRPDNDTISYENRAMERLRGVHSGATHPIPPYGSLHMHGHREEEGTMAPASLSLRPLFSPSPASGYQQPSNRTAGLGGDRLGDHVEERTFMNIRPRPGLMSGEIQLGRTTGNDRPPGAPPDPSDEIRRRERRPSGRFAASVLRATALLPERETRTRRPTDPGLIPNAQDFQPSSSYARPNPYSDDTGRYQRSFDQVDTLRQPPAEPERENRPFAQYRQNVADLRDTGSNHRQGYHPQGGDEPLNYVSREHEQPDSVQYPSLPRYGQYQRTAEYQVQPRPQDITRNRQQVSETPAVWGGWEQGFLPPDVAHLQSVGTDAPREGRPHDGPSHSTRGQNEGTASRSAQLNERDSLGEVQGGRGTAMQAFAPPATAQHQPQAAGTAATQGQSHGRSTNTHRERDRPLSERIAALKTHLEEVFRLGK